MEVILAIVLILSGLALGPIARFLEAREEEMLYKEWRRRLPKSQQGSSVGFMTGIGGGGTPPPPKPKGGAVLAVFAVLVLTLGLVTGIRYWPHLSKHQDDLFFWGWLFLTMIFGMFVQVLSINRREGRPLFTVEASQLVYPLLFSIIAFYPVYGVGTSSPHTFFSFYAAFLNGFFWETTVTNAKPPANPK